MAKVPLCPLEELASGSARHFDVGRHRLAVVRIDEDVYALPRRVLYQEVPLRGRGRHRRARHRVLEARQPVRPRHRRAAVAAGHQAGGRLRRPWTTA